MEEKKNRAARGAKKIASGFFSRLLIKIFLVVFAAAVLFFAGSYIYKKITKVEFETKHAMVERRLTQCAELTLYKVRYSDVVTLKKSAALGLVNGYSIVRYTGIIRAGIRDISEAKIEMSDDGKSLKITLPPTILLGNDISSQSVFDEKRSVFVPITVQEVFDAIDIAKEDAAEEILADGLLDEADSRAKLVITQMMEPLGFSEIIVK